MAIERVLESADLAERFRAGDEDVLREVWRDVCSAIVAVLARKYHKILSRDRVEHLVLIALLHGWRRRAKYDPLRGSLAGWLYRIAGRLVAKFIGSRAGKALLIETRTEFGRLATLAGSAERPDDDGDGLSTSERAKRDELVRQALAEVPARQRAVLLADANAHDETVSTAELAREMGVADSTIRAYRQRARKRLENELRLRGIEKFLTRATP